MRIYALGRFEIHAHDEELRFDGKAQRKPIELLKVLVALGGRDVPADTLIDILWPEPGQGDGQKALDITVIGYASSWVTTTRCASPIAAPRSTRRSSGSTRGHWSTRWGHGPR